MSLSVSFGGSGLSSTAGVSLSVSSSNLGLSSTAGVSLSVSFGGSGLSSVAGVSLSVFSDDLGLSSTTGVSLSVFFDGLFVSLYCIWVLSKNDEYFSFIKFFILSEAPVELSLSFFRYSFTTFSCTSSIAFFNLASSSFSITLTIESPLAPSSSASFLNSSFKSFAFLIFSPQYRATSFICPSLTCVHL